MRLIATRRKNPSRSSGLRSPHMSEPAADAGRALATLLHLGKRARDADSLAELGFVAVNESHALLPFRQAALWLNGDSPGTGELQALSGVATIEGNAPYVLWLARLFQQAPPSEQTPVRCLNAGEISPELAGEWSDWLPPEVLLLWIPPLRHFRGGALLFAREEVWRESEISLLPEWGAMLAQALALRLPHSWLARFRRWQASWAEAPPAGAAAHPLVRLRRWLGRRSLWQLGLLGLALLSLLPVPADRVGAGRTGALATCGDPRAHGRRDRQGAGEAQSSRQKRDVPV